MTKDIITVNSLETIDSISLNTSKVKEILTSISLQAYYDSSIFSLLYYESESTAEIVKNSQRLTSLKNTFPYFHSVYAFNGRMLYASINTSNNVPNVSSEDDFFDREIIDVLNNIENYKKNSIFPRYIDNFAPDGSKLQQSLVYTYIFYNYYNAVGKVDNALIFNLSEQWFKENIDIFSNSESKIYIINRDGVLLNNVDTFNALTDISYLNYISNIIDSDADQDVFTQEINGDSSIITYKTIYPEEWVILSIIKSSSINNQILKFINETVFISAILILIGSLTVLLISRKLFLSVKNITFDMKKYLTQKRQNQYSERQIILKNIFINQIEENQERIGEMNILIDKKRKYLLILLKIDNYKHFCDKYNLNDRNIIKFGIVNIVNEVIESYGSGECLDICDDGLLLVLTEGNNISKEMTNEFLFNIRQHIYQFIKLSCTFTILVNSCEFENIKDTYISLLSLSQYRIISGKGTNIYADEFSFQNIDDFVFPTDKLSMLTQSIMSSNENDVYKYFAEILHYSAGFGPTVLTSCVSSVLISINNVFTSIKKLNNINLEYSFDFYIEQIPSFETLNEIEEYFKDNFSSIMSDLINKKSTKHEKLLNTVINYINEHYHTQDICCNSISNYVGITPSYMSKLFKKYKSVSINDYINTIRIEKAHMLLLTSPMSVTEIMDRTGFISRSHFYTLFKRTYGMTPNEVKSQSLR